MVIINGVLHEIFITSLRQLLFEYSNHRVILIKEKGEESDANFPDQNVQRHRVTSLETACSLANGPSWGRGEVCILPWELQSTTS